MQDTKSLIESRAFWSAALALTASLAASFHIADLASWAGDPASLDAIMNSVATLGALGAIVFRVSATARIASVLPPGAGPGVGKALAIVVALSALARSDDAPASPSGCLLYTSDAADE